MSSVLNIISGINAAVLNYFIVEVCAGLEFELIYAVLAVMSVLLDNF